MIQVAGLELLEQALDFSLVLREQQRSAWRGQLPSSRGSSDGLAPELAIGHAVDQGLARIPAEIAEQSIVINDTHYGRVEDAQMGICHMVCYAFVENPELGK